MSGRVIRVPRGISVMTRVPAAVDGMALEQFVNELPPDTLRLLPYVVGRGTWDRAEIADGKAFIPGGSECHIARDSRDSKTPLDGFGDADVQGLSAVGSTLTQIDLEAVSKWSSLRVLELVGSQVGKGLGALLSAHPLLETLLLGNVRTANAPDGWTPSEHLEALWIGGCGIPKGFLARAASGSRMISLHLQRASLEAGAMACLPPVLREVSLGGSAVDERDIRSLAQLLGLRVLILSDTGATEGALIEVAAAAADLRVLDVRGTGAGAGFVKSLHDLKSLRVLDIDLDPSNSKEIQTLKSLRRDLVINGSRHDA